MNRFDKTYVRKEPKGVVTVIGMWHDSFYNDPTCSTFMLFYRCLELSGTYIAFSLFKAFVILTITCTLDQFASSPPCWCHCSWLLCCYQGLSHIKWYYYVIWYISFMCSHPKLQWIQPVCLLKSFQSTLTSVPIPLSMVVLQRLLCFLVIVISH